MSAITQRNDTSLAAPERNYYEQYAEAAQQNRIVGELLKFSKGEYLSGQDGEEVDEGTRLVANMNELMIGWVRWDGGKPTDMQMGRVAEGFQPARRPELGDTDKEAWETDESTGQPRDPWQLTNYLIMKEEAGDQLYTFATSSKGGLGAVAALAGAYGKAMRQKPNLYPVVALNVDSYKHSNKSYGKIFVPKLDIVGWVERAELDDALAADAAAHDDGQEEMPLDAAPAAKGGKPKPAAPKSEF